MPTSAAADLPGGPFDLARIGQGLVFAQSLPELNSILTKARPGGAVAVIQAPPGTGKTTLVPPLVANALGGSSGRRILVTQPRRVAVRSAAKRLSFLEGTTLGSKVGYTVRGENHSAPETIIEFLTPGILLRRLLHDPGLDGVSAVILDEVHERGLDTDLLLGMLAEVRQLRGDLTVLAMSATLDAARFAQLLAESDDEPPAPVVDCPSALHPLEIRWVPAAVSRMDQRGISRSFLDHVADTASAAHASALAEDPSVDALVFVPGAREVEHVVARLRGRSDGVEILSLHGQVPAQEQDRAVSSREPGGRPRIIVSTSLAESSLTVPGVRLVIDSGLSREPRRDAARGMTGLVTVSTSRASAEQRAGRAARLGPGTVVRCYEQKALAVAAAHPMPEIAVAELSSAALLMACWGAPAGVGLRLPEAAPVAALQAAIEVLRELGALDERGHATVLGRTLADIPADPRLARALLDGAPIVGATAAAEIVALVAGDARAPGADLGALLSAMRAGRDPGASRWNSEVRRLEKFARSDARRANSQRSDTNRTDGNRRDRQGPGTAPGTLSVAAAEAVGFVVGLAYPDRVARRVADATGEQYLLSSGTRAGLPAGSSLAGHHWLAVAEVARAQGRDAAGTGAVIRAAAPLAQIHAEIVAAHLLQDSVEAEFRSSRLSARRTRRLGAVILSATPVKPSIAQGRRAVAAALERDGLDLLPWSTSADSLRRRLALLHREIGAPWPDVSDSALTAHLSEWLGPELEAVAGGRALSALSLTDPLRRLLPWPEAGRLGELAPEALTVPSGSKIKIDYPEVSDGGPPVVAVKLQECFGLAQTPTIAGGRVRVLFHLLSPARRPLALTDDLASFWSGPYTHVRAEMRGRYPKHPWPQDPWSAPATSKLKSRM